MLRDSIAGADLRICDVMILRGIAEFTPATIAAADGAAAWDARSSMRPSQAHGSRGDSRVASAAASPSAADRSRRRMTDAHEPSSPPTPMVEYRSRHVAQMRRCSRARANLGGNRVDSLKVARLELVLVVPPFPF